MRRLDALSDERDARWVESGGQARASASGPERGCVGAFLGIAVCVVVGAVALAAIVTWGFGKVTP